MKRLALAGWLLLCCDAEAQKVRTVVPHDAIVAGNAFQVQYIISAPAHITGIIPPAFDNFRLVSGPNYYKGDALVEGRQQAIENITYTLVPVKPGPQKISGLSVLFRDLPAQKSEDAAITVVAAPKASFDTRSSYTDVNLYAPQPAADRYRLISDNLFIRVEVDRKTCYIGEPVTAVFKLYSRLQSTSEVTNSPGLYGFSVMDMLDINEAHQSVETIGGQVFNTSILRKLQLYPQQEGRLVIDGMELQNEVEFDDPQQPGHQVKLGKLLSSAPVTILARALPAGKPDDYTGAVGRFRAEAKLSGNRLEKGGQGILTVTVTGAGNFIQFAPPAVRWPRGVEIFDADVADQLDRLSIPAAGSRRYSFHFAADSPGHYTLPPVSFSFFDPAAHRYQTVRTDTLTFEVIDAAVKPAARAVRLAPLPKYGPWIILPALLAGLAAWRYLRKRPATVKGKDAGPTIGERLAAVASASDQQAGVEIGKILREAQQQGKLLPAQQKEMQAVLDDCQLLAYASARVQGKKEELIERTRRLLMH